MSSEQTRQKWFRVRYVVAALLLAVVASCSGISVVLSSYNTCEIGHGVARFWDIYVFTFFLPLQVLVYVVPVVGANVLTGRYIPSTRIRVGVATFVTVAILLAMSWAFLAHNGLPLLNDRCPSGAPAWWPRWLPPDPQLYPGDRSFP